MDKRRNYSSSKIIALEMWFIFQSLAIHAVAYKLGYDKWQLTRVVDEWETNDGYLTIESKMNNGNTLD